MEAQSNFFVQTVNVTPCVGMGGSIDLVAKSIVPVANSHGNDPS
jgi:hypothetical protein